MRIAALTFATIAIFGLTIQAEPPRPDPLDAAKANQRIADQKAEIEVRKAIDDADRLIRTRPDVAAKTLRAAQSNLDITLEQYRAGTVSYLNVVVAQTAALSSENTLLSVRNRQLAAVNQLLKNIAGRWQPA